MWGALKSDFTEFVTTVTHEATDKLSALDKKFDEKDNYKKKNKKQTAMHDFIDADAGVVMMGYTNEKDEDDDEEDDDDEDMTPPLTDPKEIREYLYQVDDVFFDPLPKAEDTEEEADAENKECTEPSKSMFVDLDAKTEEIASLLQENPTLEATFSRLNDQVNYKDFWSRLFWRLDDERVQETYQYYYPKQVQRERQRQEEERKTSGAGGGAFKSVTSFLGGAVKRMIDEEGNDNGKEGEGDQFFNTAQQTGASAMNFFKGGGRGRPPFVLNTAVSEDDADEDDDEEEELGWDDDDDDEDLEIEDNVDTDEDEEEDDKDGQIEFKDAEKELLQEELDQAMNERDLLHKTVEMQTEEIKKLKEGIGCKEESKQVEALKMELFEKDSELAALRARLEDDRYRDDDEEATQNDGTAVKAQVKFNAQLSEELNNMREQMNERDTTIAKLQQEVEQAKKRVQEVQPLDITDSIAEMQAQLEQAVKDSETQKEMLSVAEIEKAALKEQIESMKEATGRLEGDNYQLRAAQDDSTSEVSAQLVTAQQELLKLKSELEEVQTSKAGLEAELVDSRQKLASLEQSSASQAAALKSTQDELSNALTELKITRDQLECAREDSTKAESSRVRPSSPGSASTGVKAPAPEDKDAPPSVPEPEPPAVTKVEVAPGDDDDSDWGDW